MLNQIVVMGRFTKEPEIRYTSTQKPVASFTVAVDRDFNSGEQKQTDFIDCTAWNARAEFVSKYFHKGSMAVVSGRLQINHWEDKDGKKRTSWFINAENIYFGESKRGNSDAAAQNEWTPIGDDDGEIPF